MSTAEGAFLGRESSTRVGVPHQHEPACPECTLWGVNARGANARAMLSLPGTLSTASCVCRQVLCLLVQQLHPSFHGEHHGTKPLLSSLAQLSPVFENTVAHYHFS